MRTKVVMLKMNLLISGSCLLYLCSVTFSCCDYQRTYKASDWKGRSPATKFLSIFAKPNANCILESSDAYRLISLALGSKDVAKDVQTWPNPWKNSSASSNSRISVLDLVRTAI